MKKMKYATKIWKFSFLKITFFENFHFWNLKWKFPFEIWNFFGHITIGKRKKLEWKNIYFIFAIEIELTIILLYYLLPPSLKHGRWRNFVGCKRTKTLVPLFSKSLMRFESFITVWTCGGGEAARGVKGDANASIIRSLAGVESMPTVLQFLRAAGAAVERRRRSFWDWVL
jgi:hypothetical protein